jgi:hypothetical protein
MQIFEPRLNSNLIESNFLDAARDEAEIISRRLKSITTGDISRVADDCHCFACSTRV